ncbi:MAG TPA: NAD(P)/FAD-dependent oxidoreductase [Thermodesulfobacteriota bacterium]|nr:NAD(P)/FAD-dependent oxidoreductase [Thermodesulfobacteriota bacterium]
MVEAPLTEAYDIVVVGAGPAGSSAAKAAAQRGAQVLLIDRRQRIGVPVQCAELVTQWISRYAHFSSNCVIQTTETMVTHLFYGASPDKIDELKSPGYMVDRSLFDKELVTSAIVAGAKISTGTKAIGLSSKGLWVEQGSKREVIRSEVIIGADGVHSLLRRWAGLPPVKTMVALQYEVVNPRPQHQAEVFFSPDYVGGYAWFFPKGRTANVGIGIVPSKTPALSNLLDQFLYRLVELKRLSTINIVGRTGGSIPCEGPRQTIFQNILLAGDAAGHTHPITGAGILNAIMGGEIAGRVAAEAVARGDLKYLGNYEIEWREAMGAPLFYGAKKRQFLEENWIHSEIGFENLIRKTWVTFKEYYEDRKKKENLMV